MLYVQLNRAGDAPAGPLLVDCAAGVRADIARHPPARLVLDLRFNTGGDLTKARDFIEALAASPLGREPGA